MPGILRYPSPFLAVPALPVAAWSETLRGTCETLRRVHAQTGGAGLAAPQIGIGLRLIAFGAPAVVLVNPRIAESSKTTARDFEACLSLPGVRAAVERPAAILLEYDTPWRVERVRLSGLAARVVQHEIDHLDGILFWDRLGKLARQRLQEAYARRLKIIEAAEVARERQQREGRQRQQRALTRLGLPADTAVAGSAD